MTTHAIEEQQQKLQRQEQQKQFQAPTAPVVRSISEVGEHQSIPRFFHGRFILVTGATGFLGKVLIEKLLYSCPTIAGIYVVVRPKRDKTAAERLDEFAACPLFRRLREREPDFTRTKLHPIQGDVTAPNLGISPEEELVLREKISVVIHSAATIRFDEKIKDAVEMNINGPLKVYSLCKRLPHLLALIHVSTAYANCNRECVLEAVYPPPPNYDNWLDVLQWVDENDLDKLTSDILGERPNTYTYTKCLAEHFLMEEFRRDPLPFAIVRPSIVGGTAREPFPGWVDNFNGPTSIFAAIGTGMLRSMHCNEQGVADLIPVDFVANTLIAAAWFTATKKPQDVIVYNCTSGQLNPMTWREMADHCVTGLEKCPLERSIRRPKIGLSKSGLTSTVAWYLRQLFPAYVYDCCLRAVGRKPYLVRLQGRVHKAVTVLEYFTCNSWQFNSGNVTSLRNALSPEDAKEFDFDITSLDWQQYMHLYVKGTKIFCLKESTENLDKAKKRHFRLMIFWLVLKLVGFLSLYHFLRRFVSRTKIAKRIMKEMPSAASIYCLIK